jgi:hypothetical protein
MSYNRRMTRYACTLVFVCAACGGGGPGDGDSGSHELDMDSGAAADAGSSRLDAGPARDSSAAIDANIADSGRAPDAGAFPGCEFVDALDDFCTEDGDCTFGIHQTDCCGNSHAVGFNTSDRARFDAWEPLCAATYPICGCPSYPPRTDSDEVATDPSAIQLACVSRGPRNVCLTYITERPLDGR